MRSEKISVTCVGTSQSLPAAQQLNMRGAHHTYDPRAESRRMVADFVLSLPCRFHLIESPHGRLENLAHSFISFIGQRLQPVSIPS